jgi:hypothetical protein
VEHEARWALASGDKTTHSGASVLSSRVRVPPDDTSAATETRLKDSGSLASSPFILKLQGRKIGWSEGREPAASRVRERRMFNPLSVERGDSGHTGDSIGQRTDEIDHAVRKALSNRPKQSRRLPPDILTYSLETRASELWRWSILAWQVDDVVGEVQGDFIQPKSVCSISLANTMLLLPSLYVSVAV